MSQVKDRRWYKAYHSNIPREIEIPEVSVYTFLENSAKNFGKRTAIIQDSEPISYHQLKEWTEKLAGAFHRLGLKKGDRIGLMISNRPSYIISYYAAMKLGLIVVQINPRYTTRELLQIVNDSEPRLMIVEGDAVSSIKKLVDFFPLEYILVVDSEDTEYKHLEDILQSAEPFNEVIEIDAKEDVAVIQYTGGTTGTIKGAMLTHYNLVANVYQSHGMYGDEMKFGEEMVLTAIPLYHVYGMTVAMNLGIYIGATLLLVNKFEVKPVLEMIEEYKATFFPAVPRMYNSIVNYQGVENFSLKSLKFCTSGSAPLPVEVIRKFERLTGAVIGEGYGLTECSPSTHRNPYFWKRKIGSIGIPFQNTDCKIIGEDNVELPIGSIGELIIKGPQVMKGYWRNEEETRNVLKDGWLYTGDLAKQDEDGYFYIVGRKKEMIINGGFNVYPQEIENVLYEHPDIHECAVVGIPDIEKGEVVKAYLVAKEGRTIDLEDIKGFCYRNLTPYKVPEAFEVIDELPRNTVGKILKRVLIDKEIKQ